MHTSHVVSVAWLFFFAVFTSAVKVDWTTIKDRRGGGLPDFSYAGYRSSNSPLPSAKTTPAKTLSAGTGDRSTAIQNAINAVSQAGGGVVLLKAGRYSMIKGITVQNGTTLRGAGTSKTILLPASGSFDLITMGSEAKNPALTHAADITDQYVPVGATTLTVKSSSALTVGQTVMIQRAVTASWVKANGMDTLTRGGKPQTWLAAGSLIQQPRTIKSISGTKVTIDIPLTDALDAKYMESSIQSYQFPQAASEMGVENLGIHLSPTCSGKKIDLDECSHDAISFPSWTSDSFVRNLDITGYNEFILFATRSFRHTVQNVRFHRDGAINKEKDGFSGYDGEIRLEGTQILIADCATYVSSSSDKDDLFTSFPVATEARTPGPNAVVNYYSQYPISALFPHQRWAHGFLADNCTSSLELLNRGNAGSGHGWAITQGVGWNVDASSAKNSILNVSSPPLGENFCVGCRGNKLGNGRYIEFGAPVEPVSLFAEQLSKRKG